MGLGTEVAADITAKKLENILEAALLSNNKEILVFCREHIIPFYKSEKMDAGGLSNEILLEKILAACAVIGG